MLISKICVFSFEERATALLAQSTINSNFAHVAKVEGRFLNLTAGTSELLEAKRIALSLGGVECESAEPAATGEDRKSKWSSPRGR